MVQITIDRGTYNRSAFSRQGLARKVSEEETKCATKWLTGKDKNNTHFPIHSGGDCETLQRNVRRFNATVKHTPDTSSVTHDASETNTRKKYSNFMGIYSSHQHFPHRVPASFVRSTEREGRRLHADEKEHEIERKYSGVFTEFRTRQTKKSAIYILLHRTID
jgi:hypothetical protein